MAKGDLLVKQNTPQPMVHAKMGIGLSIKTAADQNHKPALRALPFWEDEIFNQLLA